MEDKLNKHLDALGYLVVDKLSEYKLNNINNIKSTLHEYRPVKNLRYDYDGIMFDLDRENFFQFNRYELTTNQLMDFVSQISMEQTYSDSLNAIDEFMAPNHVDKDEAIRKPFLEQVVLQQYLFCVSKRAIQDDFQKEEINTISQILINDLSLNGTIRLKGKIYLKNIFIDVDSIELSKGIKIKRISSNELTSSTNYLYETEMDTFASRHIPRTCYLEINVEMKNDLSLHFDSIKNRIWNTSRTIIASLRLFKIADIYEDSTDYITDSILHYAFGENIASPYSEYMDSGFLPKDGTSFIEKFSISEAEEFKKFAKDLEHVISRIKRSSYFEGEPDEIAFHRYTDALLRSKLHINRISYCLYSLDAMLVGYEEQGKEKKITHRTALLISLITNNKIAPIKEKLKDAYQIRSRLVHGGKIEGPLKTYAQTSTKELLNYTRIVLLVFLQLSHKMTKEKFNEILKTADNKKGLELLKVTLSSLNIPL